MNQALSVVANILVGRRFDHEEDEYVVTWNDEVYLRATPLSCPTGLTSKEFRVDEIGIVNMREDKAAPHS